MPSYQKREFQLGDFWISKRAGSDAWCRTWFDPATRQTRRASLGTTDFREAKERLTAWFIEQHRPQNALPVDVPLADVFVGYYQQHAQHTRSAEALRIHLGYWTEFYGTATVGDLFSVAKQEAFRAWLKSRGHSAGYMARLLSTGRAALNWSHKRGELQAVPHILVPAVRQAEPRGRPLSLDEMVSLFDAMHDEHLVLFSLLLIGTLCRPEAARQFTREQIDFEHGLVYLNPKGREQTKKYRPTVKLPRPLVPLLLARPPGHLVTYNGQPIVSIKRAFRAARERAGLGADVNPYSFRHSMAKWLRMRSVPPWEVAAQLGHRLPGMSTTEIYAPFDPAYLVNAAREIEAYLACLKARCWNLCVLIAC